MPHILVLDWDQREIRYVLGQTSGRDVRVLALDSLPLPAAGEHPQQADQAFAAEIKVAGDSWKAGRARVLVALPRSGVELLYLTLPPASDEELPELVANQAVQESPTISEQTLLDFLPAAGGPEAPRSVLVAALADEEQQRIRGRLAAAGLTPQRIVLRPLGGASLFRRLISASEQTCLVINRVGQDLELNVVAPDRLGFTRTVRLPEQVSDEDVADRLVAEAKRTVLATPREHVGDEGIRNVYVFGRPADYESLAADIGGDVVAAGRSAGSARCGRSPRRGRSAAAGTIRAAAGRAARRGGRQPPHRLPAPASPAAPVGALAGRCAGGRRTGFGRAGAGPVRVGQSGRGERRQPAAGGAARAT